MIYPIDINFLNDSYRRHDQPPSLPKQLFDRILHQFRKAGDRVKGWWQRLTEQRCGVMPDRPVFAFLIDCYELGILTADRLDELWNDALQYA